MIRSTSDDMQVILDSLPQLFFHKDTQNNILRVNQAVASAVGTTVDELVGTNCTKWFPDEAGDYYKDDQEVMATRVPRLGIIEQFQVEGDSKHWISTDKFPHFDDDGHVDGILVFISDVTVESNAEHERLELEAQVRHAQKHEGIGVLAMGVAHDVNNHLMAIVGDTDLALNLVDEGSDAKVYLDNIIKSTTAASDVCRQLLAYAGKQKVNLKPCYLSDIILEVEDLLQVSISKKAKLILKLQQQLPAVNVDSSQVKQILMNLVTNASDAIDKQSGEIQLSTGTRCCDEIELSRSITGETLVSGHYSFIKVSDTGSGMSESVLEQIFQPFYTTKNYGRGLGLATVIGTLRTHKGAISVSSKVSVGSTIELLFPITEKTVEQQVSVDRFTTTPKQDTLILVVDDNESVRCVLEIMLKDAGYSVITASDGQIAINIFDKSCSDINAVVLDFGMPGLDGTEVFTLMNKRKPGIPILFSSGNTDQIVLKNLSEEVPFNCIKKPYRKSDLLDKLGSLLEG